ncbi:hypothetical protein CCR75_007638 [Bremia lactucae]|uniref:ELMO domain-containing protein n=1 Tax=Bremia lactucae TaxID=4779 RepID=A0A976FMJ8_BRELC|nr:hypothetical protein CCR75_007638 [Bremia lactucae]
MADLTPTESSFTPPSIDPSVFAVLPQDIQQELLLSFPASTNLAAPVSRTLSLHTNPWTCHVCTFRNHPELPECEMCGTLCAPFEADNKIVQPEHPGRTVRSFSTPTISFVPKIEPDDLRTLAFNKFQLVKESWTGRRLRTKSATLGTRAVLPSLYATCELMELRKDLTHKVLAGDEWFETALERLWRVVGDRNKDVLYDRNDVDWVKLGFQNASPETDFRGGGVLAMKCLLYAFEAHPVEMRAIYYTEMPDATQRKRWYPVCVAGINLTCLLAGLLQLGDGKFTEKKDVFWPLFQDPASFYELFYLAFIKMDAIWHRLSATYMEFGVVLQITRKVVVCMLEQAPASLRELREASDQTYLERFVINLSARSMAEWEEGECPGPFCMLETEDALVIAKTRAVSN